MFRKPISKRILAARRNGTLSHGPTTPEGALRSSRNATRHGLTAKCIVLPSESAESFEALLAQYVARFSPVDDYEMGIIEEMAASYWRLRRAWAVETNMLETATDAQPPGPELHRLTAAFASLAATPLLALLHRYEARLHLMHQRALHNLLWVRQDALQNEPTDAELELIDEDTGDLAPQTVGVRNQTEEIPPEGHCS